MKMLMRVLIKKCFGPKNLAQKHDPQLHRENYAPKFCRNGRSMRDEEGGVETLLRAFVKRPGTSPPRTTRNILIFHYTLTPFYFHLII